MKFRAIFQLQTVFPTKNIPSKYAESIKFDAKRLRKKLCLRLGINLIIAIFKQKRNRKFDFFSERLFFIPLMNTKSSIFACGFATHENTASFVHLVK